MSVEIRLVSDLFATAVPDWRPSQPAALVSEILQTPQHRAPELTQFKLLYPTTDLHKNLDLILWALPQKTPEQRLQWGSDCLHRGEVRPKPHKLSLGQTLTCDITMHPQRLTLIKCSKVVCGHFKLLPLSPSFE